MTVFLHILDTGPPAANFFHPETVSLDLFSVPHELKKAWVGASPEDAGAWPETLCLQRPGFSLNLGRKVRLPTSLLFLQPALSTGECSASEPGDFQNTKDQLLQVVQNAASSLRNREWEGQTVLQKPVSRGFRPLWHRQAGLWVRGWSWARGNLGCLRGTDRLWSCKHQNPPGSKLLLIFLLPPSWLRVF